VIWLNGPDTGIPLRRMDHITEVQLSVTVLGNIRVDIHRDDEDTETTFFAPCLAPAYMVPYWEDI